MRGTFPAILAFFAFQATSASADDGLTRSCDLLAASPYDTSRPADIAGINQIDPKVALPACQAALAADPHNVRLQFEMGLVSETLKDDIRARGFFEAAAAQGNAAAANELGTLYDLGGGGLPKNDKEAARHYVFAAEQGNALGQFNLGRYFGHGRGGLPQSDEKAVQFFRTLRRARGCDRPVQCRHFLRARTRRSA